MNEQQKVEKLKEIFADKAFAEKVLSLDTAEEVKKELDAKGLELTVEEIGEIQKSVAKQLESGEEMDPEQLKNVAGGFGIITALIVDAIIIAASGAAAAGVHRATRRRW